MTNSEIADKLKLTANLLELLDDNPFKIKSLLNASFKIDKLDIDLHGLSQIEIESIDGIGKGIATKINELNQTATTTELQELLHRIPVGVIQMMDIKGIGPKKVALLWKQLGIESPGELLYACNENRLIELKGFGEKTQTAIRKSIEFNLSNEGKFLYAEIEAEAYSLLSKLQQQFPNDLFAYAGDFIRKMEIIESLELLTSKKDLDLSEIRSMASVAIELTVVNAANFGCELFLRSGSKEFLNAFAELLTA
jgi:DNA polymerase (family 10)